jgi:hypothetical protein
MFLYLFIILIIIISIILYTFFTILDKLIDDSKLSNENNKETFSNFNIKDSFDINNSSDINNQNVINSPSTVSIPANESNPIVHTGYNCIHPISLDVGKYTFPIPKLLYDGIWDRKVKSDGNGNQENQWTLPNGFILEGSYSTNKFIQPTYNFKDGMCVLEKNCENNDNNNYLYCN